MSTQNQSRNQAIIPIIVKQIRSCKQPQFHIFGISVQIISLVGVVRRIRIQSCEINCEIQDFSGTVKCLTRLETESEVSEKLNGIKENSYVKIVGFMRFQEGQNVVLITKFFPVNDINVITNHILQAIFFTLRAKIERKRQLVSANSTGSALADSLVMSDDTYGETSSVAPKLTDFQRLVYNIVKSEYSEIGVARRNILRQFPSYQGIEVNQALEYLINEGLIYYSIDQEHLKAADLN